MLDIEQIEYKIKHLIPYLFGKWKSSGLLPMKEDNRDYKLGSWFSGDAYIPKNQSVDIKEISTKNQGYFNTCVYNSAIGSKEIDEKVELSVRDLVNYASRKGYLGDKGLSDLRSGQKCLQDYGCREEKDFHDGNYASRNDWNGYINQSIDTVKAGVHKIKTFWGVSKKDEILQLLDDGRAIHCAMPWYSGYNQSGGFSHPWLITKALGYFVGGHALWIKGYIQNYNGNFVVKIKNSYGENWGDKGCFYIDIDFFLTQINLPNYGAFVNLDVENEIASFLNTYNGKNVKVAGQPTIYKISGGKKLPYLHEMDYFVWNINDQTMKNFELVDKIQLDKIIAGDPMDLTQSELWPLLKNVAKPWDYTRIIEALKLNK